MKANEYFKKHGYRKCKSACAENGWLNTGFWIQLKRLIKSHELVDAVGGMDKAKLLLRMRIAAELHDSADEIEKAIIDVESCQ